MLSTHQWNSAKRTGAVTTFRYFHVSIMLWCSQIIFHPAILFYNPLQIVLRSVAVPSFRNKHLLPVSLLQDYFYSVHSGNPSHILYPVCLFCFKLYLVKNGIDAFFFCFFNKSTGIHHHDIVIQFFILMHHINIIGQ